MQNIFWGKAIFYQFLAAVTAIFYHAAAGLPIITALALVSGRRGHAPFFLWAGQRLVNLNLFLSLACPLYLFFNYWGEISHYEAPLARQLAPLLAAPGLPWTTAFLASVCAVAFLQAAAAALRRLRTHWRGERLAMLQIRSPIIWCLFAAFSFFATFLLLHWPFAGLPEGLTWDRATLAVGRYAMRNYFMTFSPAGALCLLGLMVWARQLDHSHLPMSVRYFAFWAAAGLIPHWLVTWGMRLGVGVRSQGAVAQGMAGQDPALICLTLAIFCWAFILWKPRYWRSFSVVAFILLLARTVLPFFKDVT